MSNIVSPDRRSGGALRAAALAGALVPAFLASPILSPALAQQQGASDTRAVLAQYGDFSQHERYGEVWRPKVTPAGWHPYMACNWVRTRQFGWYYDDKTPWGQIVHHYGRWTNDQQLGWIWVSGAEFSPGWVVWRTSPQYVGWAPTPPDVDVGVVQSAAFNTGSQWTFMDAAKMRSGCSPTAVMPGQQVPLMLRETRFVTEVEYVDGVATFVLPQYISLPLVNINVGFNPWPANFFAQTIMNWNWAWSNLVIVVNINGACGI
jgi:hypothetical protein